MAAGALDWQRLDQVKQRLGSVIAIAIALIISEAIFITGAAIVTVSAGRSLIGNKGGVVGSLTEVVNLRSAYRSLAEHASRDRGFRFGFNLNWFGAAATGAVLTIGIIVVLPVATWGLLVIPMLDLTATFGWRIPVRRRLQAMERDARIPRLLVRQATAADIPRIIQIDSERYGTITEAQTDDPAGMFALRIKNSPGWFFVGEVDGTVEGLMSCQPTINRPADFTSWDKCTAGGTLEGSLDQRSPFVYVVALTVSSRGSGAGLSDKIIVAAIKKAIQTGKKEAFFASRMPDYHKHCNEISADEYASKRVDENGKDVAFDWQIRFYEEIGMRQRRVVQNGFPEDWESCGYSVLFTFPIPFSEWPLPGVWARVFEAAASRPKLMSLASRYL